MSSLKYSKKKIDDCNYTIKNNAVNWHDMDKAINKAKGQYIFFCDVNMVLEPCVFERIVPTADDKMVAINSKAFKENQLVDLDSILYTIAGKMFDKKIITQNQIHFKENELCPEYLFMAEYMCCCKQMEDRKDVYLYGIEKQLMFNQVSNLNSQNIKVYIEKVANSCWNSLQQEKLITTFLCDLFDYVDIQDNDKRIIVESAIEVAQKFKNNPAVIYNFSKRQLQTMFTRVLEENDNELWEVFQVFFAEIDNADLQKVLCALFGIDETKYELLSKYSLNEFKFYNEKLPSKKSCDYNTNSNQLLSELLEIKKLVIETESKQILTKCEKEIVYQPISLQGNELGVCFVNECAAGKMGLKFIIKEAIGWTKYKIKIK